MVAKVANFADHNPAIADMERILKAQKASYNQHRMPSAEERISLIKRLKPALIRHQDALVDAVNKDFGNRCATETRFVEIASLVETIKYNTKNLTKWMRPERRSLPVNLRPAKAKVVYQPLGVVGIIVPWNYPYFLALDPMIAAMAAGNRVMIKMSEFTPNAAEAMKAMLAEVYSEDQVAVITGEADVGIAFSKLPFDHLLFTGSTAVGKHVMAAAAENLTPVTLELGGKSPALIHESFPLKDAAERMSWGKCINAGQTCVAPDYTLVHRSKLDEFTAAFNEVVSTWYPSKRNNDDYTAVINERQLNRLKGYLKDAEEKGARIVPLNPANEDFEGSGKLPITLVFDTTEDMLIEQNEIFGPLLIVKPYDNLEEAMQYINDRPRPLALYYFDYDKDRADYVLNHTHSGGACVNDTLSHVAAEDIPFGGVGPSGMGHYHGKEGFLTFTKAKGVFYKGKVNATKLLFPPWNRRIHKMVLKLALKPD
ncbi:coniferyl aldehyde dehydrogenase [Ketobacter alkanivorans]|uniref:Aldehyde dehydrogenase n=1 Tax=Ketobacter alkanivorans TaxID=1917421 RepID=A0A2K9LK80_9GAMM|nr:coniferyl aldehyde dehydrogenase [Ketobacter alkanivorans]AUM12748.1 coniferyl-aldehyde dehydrogenase [Ketobacter alkanivorans]MCP5013703.1 coniferyl aldehyde dehydrogenase [Ketobacter sp.]